MANNRHKERRCRVMAKNITAQGKIDILKTVFLPLIKEKITNADRNLQQAQDDYINLYGDGDISKVTRNPIISVVDGQVQVEILDKLIADVERVLIE